MFDSNNADNIWRIKYEKGKTTLPMYRMLFDNKRVVQEIDPKQQQEKY
jgi:hypothetical protein